MISDILKIIEKIKKSSLKTPLETVDSISNKIHWKLLIFKQQ